MGAINTPYFIVIPNVRKDDPDPLRSAEGIMNKVKAKTNGTHSRINWRPDLFRDVPGCNGAHNSHWITMYVCSIPDTSQDKWVLKIGTSDIPEYWNTIAKEMQKGLSKGIALCEAGTLEIYVYKSGNSKKFNQLLEECLRYWVKPVSVEPDVRSDPCQAFRPRRERFMCNVPGGCLGLRKVIVS